MDKRTDYWTKKFNFRRFCDFKKGGIKLNDTIFKKMVKDILNYFNYWYKSDFSKQKFCRKSYAKFFYIDIIVKLKRKTAKLLKSFFSILE